ncbi:hypothetical protein GCM10027452_42310 [Micromonospora halotolerans]
MPERHVLDSTIHHTETGDGPTFVFLHGNPGSSHTWRGVLPRIGAGSPTPRTSSPTTPATWTPGSTRST